MRELSYLKLEAIVENVFESQQEKGRKKKVFKKGKKKKRYLLVLNMPGNLENPAAVTGL